jgi:hypothetical protein
MKKLTPILGLTPAVRQGLADSARRFIAGRGRWALPNYWPLRKSLNSVRTNRTRIGRKRLRSYAEVSNS